MSFSRVTELKIKDSAHEMHKSVPDLRGRENDLAYSGMTSLQKYEG
jgi:hypothetical protein